MLRLLCCPLPWHQRIGSQPQAQTQHYQATRHRRCHSGIDCRLQRNQQAGSRRVQPPARRQRQSDNYPPRKSRPESGHHAESQWKVQHLSQQVPDSPVSGAIPPPLVREESPVWSMGALRGFLYPLKGSQPLSCRSGTFASVGACGELGSSSTTPEAPPRHRLTNLAPYGKPSQF